MPESELTERQLLGQLLEALRELPHVHADLGLPVESGGPGRRYDARIDLSVDGKTVTLLIEVKKVLYPRDVRQALWQLQELARGWPQSVNGRQTAFLLAAHSISPGAKDLLRDERVGYYDSGGSLFIPADVIYVYVDKPPPKALSNSIRSVFSGRRAQVLHALLMRHGEWIGGKEIAEVAQVSPATVSQVLTKLERFDWVVSRGQGPSKERQLREPGALLDSWAKQLSAMQPLAMRRYFVPSLRGEGLLKKFGEVCALNKADYAITHEAAGQLYAPFLSTVSQVRSRLIAGAAADGVLGALDARFVDQGANLAVIAVKSSGELLFRQVVDGTWLAESRAGLP